MDPVSGTASVLTLLSFALASTKFIHQAISSIKNGPVQLCTFVREVETLQKILEQFKIYQGQVSCSEADLEIVSSLVSACNDDLVRYKTEIKKITSSSKGKLTVVWKRCRSLIRENDFQRMHQEMNDHTTKLGNQLGILQR